MADSFQQNSNRFSYFTHPNSVCMTYLQHAKLSLIFCFKFLGAGCKAFVHAFFPNLFRSSTSDSVSEISDLIKKSGCRNDSS